MKDFDTIRRSVPVIHVFLAVSLAEGGGITLLVPQTDDHGSVQAHEHFIVGTGTHQDPLRYRSAINASPHFAIIDLWYKKHACSETEEVFIEVNDWLLRIEQNGVRAEDGHFTKFQ